MTESNTQLNIKKE